MQSLALNVEVLNAQGQTVALKEEDTFESDRAAEELGINLSRNEASIVDVEYNNEFPTY
jgi:DNA-directed RNA polymerase subunit beta